jgi:uncharacterized membrane protein
MARRPNPATALAGLLTVAGIAHFVAPTLFDQVVPESLPGRQRDWTYLSGVAELAVGAAVAVPRTRRLGGLLAAGLFIGVFPANIKMAVDWADRPLPQRALAYARLPLQLPLVLWALKVRRAQTNTSAL